MICGQFVYTLIALVVMHRALRGDYSPRYHVIEAAAVDEPCWRIYRTRDEAELCVAGLNEMYSGLRRFEWREQKAGTVA